MFAKKKNKLKIDSKETFLDRSVDSLQSNWNSDFQENALKEYYNKWLWSYDYFLYANDALLLIHTTIWIKS